jgi:hypothetical protein
MTHDFLWLFSGLCLLAGIATFWWPAKKPKRRDFSTGWYEHLAEQRKGRS